ncbi:hypothetical protein V6N13_005867 [Hibiscus sabdariffa]
MNLFKTFGKSRATTRNDVGNIDPNQVIFHVYPNKATMDVELVMNYTDFVDSNREVHRYEREDAQLEKLGRTGKIEELHLDSMEIGTGLTRVLIATVERKSNLFNVNYREPTLLPNYGHLVDLVNEVVDKNCLMFVSSAGNSWLASSTIGTPGGIYSSLAGVGAYVFSTMAISAYSVVESFALHFESWGYQVKGGESTYTLAMYNLDVTRKYLATEGSKFLWKQFSFFKTLNLKESSVLVETCRVLIFVQESEDTVRLFADKLLRTTEKSTASTTFLLQTLPFVLDLKVSWAEIVGVALSLPECSFGMVLDIVAGTTILIPIMDSSSEEIYMVEEAVMITEKEKVLERLDSRHIHCHWATKDTSSKDDHQSYETKRLKWKYYYRFTRCG